MTTLVTACHAALGHGVFSDVAPDSTPTILGYVPWALPVLGLALLWLVRVLRARAKAPPR